MTEGKFSTPKRLGKAGHEAGQYNQSTAIGDEDGVGDTGIRCVENVGAIYAQDGVLL